MTIAERLRDLRKQFGISQQEMSRQLGISKPAWQGYELGKNEPGCAVIAKLVGLGIDANWVLTGKGTIKLSDANVWFCENVKFRMALENAYKQIEVISFSKEYAHLMFAVWKSVGIALGKIKD